LPPCSFRVAPPLVCLALLLVSGGAELLAAAISLALPGRTADQTTAASVNGPDPREIPMPPIKTALGTLPGVSEMPLRREMPAIMVMNDGTRVATTGQWARRREEMKRILEYYAVGLAPPPPGNVKGRELKSQFVMNGQVKYRLVHLTFGPEEKLSLDIGIFTPTAGGPFPAVIMPGGTLSREIAARKGGRASLLTSACASHLRIRRSPCFTGISLASPSAKSRTRRRKVVGVAADHHHPHRTL
jgi:hypothetical protein